MEGEEGPVSYEGPRKKKTEKGEKPVNVNEGREIVMRRRRVRRREIGLELQREILKVAEENASKAVDKAEKDQYLREAEKYSKKIQHIKKALSDDYEELEEEFAATLLAVPDLETSMEQAQGGKDAAESPKKDNNIGAVGNEKRPIVIEDDDDGATVQESASKRYKMNSDDQHAGDVPLTLQEAIQAPNTGKHGSISLAKLKIAGEEDQPHSPVGEPTSPPSAASLKSSMFPYSEFTQHHVMTPDPNPKKRISSTPNASEGASSNLAVTSPASPPVRKDWSSGMYLDFCHELQNSFDFNAFATKHQLPVKNIQEKFQAIVMFPIMNYSDKGKPRVIEGGRARVKDWSEAKKETRKNLREEAEMALGMEERVTV